MTFTDSNHLNVKDVLIPLPHKLPDEKTVSNTKRCDIIVARFNEDVEWTKQFSNVIIYNKGNNLTDDFNQVLLNNVGREGHTYYTYICDHYDHLSDYTIFLQGTPFDHSPNLISNLHKYIGNKELNIDFEYLSEYMIECNLTGCKYYPNLPLLDVYEKIFNEKKEQLQIRFGGGAQFIVSKEKILKKPREFYLKIVKLLEYNINPIEGHVIERFHKIIFE